MKYEDHPRCNTCAHWGKEKGYWGNPERFAICSAAPMKDDLTMWDKEAKKTVADPEFADTMMCAEDGSSYHAAVQTRDDFYCPMHSDLMSAADVTSGKSEDNLSKARSFRG